MNPVFIIKGIDASQNSMTLLNNEGIKVETNVSEATGKSLATSIYGSAEILGFIENPKLISDFSYGNGKPYVWDSKKKQMLIQCEFNLIQKKYSDCRVEDWVILSDWKK